MAANSFPENRHEKTQKSNKQPNSHDLLNQKEFPFRS